MKTYTMNEICEKLRISRPTASKLLNSGAIKGFKVGHTWRVADSEIKRIMNVPYDYCFKHDCPVTEELCIECRAKNEIGDECEYLTEV